MELPPMPFAPAMPESLVINLAARTDIGRERAKNDDTVLLVDRDKGEFQIERFMGVQRGHPAGVAVAVLDGMGGARGGNIASHLAAQTIGQILLDGGQLASPDELGARVLHSLKRAGARIRRERLQPGLGEMGTTATLCALMDSKLVIGQVGDSRAYLWRAGHVTQITRDQTLATLLVERGQLAPEEVATFEDGHIILQALGTEEEIHVDLTSVQVHRDDVLLVCSDGLSGMIDDNAISQVLTEVTDPDLACQRLIELANNAGGHDNISCVVAHLSGALLEETQEVTIEPEKLILPSELIIEEPVDELPPVAAEPPPKGILAWLWRLLGLQRSS